jgi:hypothetical protein
MWFAALSSYDQNRWFDNLMNRLQNGSPEVLGLLRRNPFPDAPPRYLRAVLWDYHFTRVNTPEPLQAWWRARPLALYAPILDRAEDQQE